MKVLRSVRFCLVLLMVGCTTTSTEHPVRVQRGVVDAEPAHAHVSLLTTSAGGFAGATLEEHVIELREQGFASSFGRSSNNPLTPCALLAAVFISATVATYWVVAADGSIQVPRPGSNLLGMFDQDIQGGRIPRDDPGKAAEIVARLFIWSSWAGDELANTLIHGLTQRECLALLLSTPERVVDTMRGVSSRARVLSHSAAVGHYSATLRQDITKELFRALRAEGFMGQGSAATDNPLAPCSLLRALHLARHLTGFWERLLLRTERDSALRGDAPAAAEAAARLFAAEITKASTASETLIGSATQAACLDATLRAPKADR